MVNRRGEDLRAGQSGGSAEWLTELLAAEADHHEPDSRRIRAAMQEGMRGGHRAPRRQRLLRTRAGTVAVVLAAAAGAFIATVGTQQLLSGSPPPAAGSRLLPASRNPGTASPQPDGGPARRSAAGHRVGPASVRATPTTPLPTSSPRAADQPRLMSATGVSDLGAFPYWIQEEVWVGLRAPVSRLHLTVTVARTAGVVSTGYWTTFSPAMFNVTVSAQASTVTYIFTLKQGQTLPAGRSTFAVQFDHVGQHNPAADTYALDVAGDEQNAAVQEKARGTF